jgi:hypothetical protein
MVYKVFKDDRLVATSPGIEISYGGVLIFLDETSKIEGAYAADAWEAVIWVDDDE